MASKLRPTEQLIQRLGGVLGLVQQIGGSVPGATRGGGSAGSGTLRGSGGREGGGGGSRVSLVGGERGLPELVNLQMLMLGQLTRLVDITQRNGISDNSATRASR